MVPTTPASVREKAPCGHSSPPANEILRDAYAPPSNAETVRDKQGPRSAFFEIAQKKVLAGAMVPMEQGS